MATVKYYWPERKKSAINELERVLEQAQENVAFAIGEVSAAESRLAKEKARLEERYHQRDECRLALEAAKRFNAEDMYND